MSKNIQITPGKGYTSFDLKSPVMSVAISNNNNYIACGLLNEEIYIITFNQVEKKWIIKKIKDASSDGRVKSICFSPNSPHIAVGLRDKIQVWNINTVKCLWEKDFKEYECFVNSVSWSPDGNSIASSSDRKYRKDISSSPYGYVKPTGYVNIWHPATGAMLNNFDTGTEYLQSVVWSSDSRYMVCGGLNLLMLWDMKDNKKVYSITMDGYIYSVSCYLDPDGILLILVTLGNKLILCSFGFSLDIVNKRFIKVSYLSLGATQQNIDESERIYANNKEYFNPSIFSFNGNFFASPYRKEYYDILIYKIIDGSWYYEKFFKLTRNEEETGSKEITSIAWSTNNTFIVSGGIDNKVILWDLYFFANQDGGKKIIIAKEIPNKRKKIIDTYKKSDLIKIAKKYEVSLKTRDDKVKTKLQLFNSLKRKGLL